MEAWHAAIHGVTKRQTRLSDWTMFSFLWLGILHLYSKSPEPEKHNGHKYMNYSFIIDLIPNICTVFHTFEKVLYSRFCSLYIQCLEMYIPCNQCSFINSENCDKLLKCIIVYNSLSYIFLHITWIWPDVIIASLMHTGTGTKKEINIIQHTVPGKLHQGW